MLTSIREKAFFGCIQLEVIEFSDDSKLQTIDKYAFSYSKIKSIKIPSSVTSIGKNVLDNCGQLEVIEFSDDSKLQTIDREAFSYSTIKCIKILPELVDLKEGWCSCISNLTKISVSTKNSRYCFFDEKMIIGKTNIEQSNYDCLVFCVRDIQRIKIPSFIEHICSHSFDYCKQLESIEFPDDSRLQTIKKSAFSSSTIKSIRIPSSVTSIGEYAFHYCIQLQVVEIPDNSKLQSIDKNAFDLSQIKCIKIPLELVDLKEGWCSFTYNLTKISVSPDNPRYFCYENKMIIGKSSIEQSNYDCLVFCVRDIQRIKIPSFIEHICSHSFDYCKQLESIEFPDDSKLQTIDKGAFYRSTIKRIRIQSSVTSIGENAFYYCEQLEVVEIPDDSKLQTIDRDAFSYSIIKRIRIQSSVTSIGENAFDCCEQLEVIEIPDDSKLQTIDRDAFSYSKIKSIQIPSSVTSISEKAFCFCKNLHIIEIISSEMISMCYTVFKDCKNVIVMIPVHS
ncbi:hypothetical protein M9Y10_015339 [Tritrichomonas musculus]|uniref:Surface antigen BspA-like n=1 Tax=Tritrichomonas musculus TaxID=1915356 RepID=A0ABR2L2V9_9EUKA